MNYFKRLEPTPASLRTGRQIFGAVAVIFGVILALMLVVPDFGDTVLWSVMAASLLTLAGTGIQYLGDPTLMRYRIGMILTAVGIVLSFLLLVANPFVSSAG